MISAPASIRVLSSTRSPETNTMASRMRNKFLRKPPALETQADLKLFRQYIGAEEKIATFSDVSINPNLNPSQISSVKANHPNVKVAMSLGDD
ncbi:hypothetical protein Vadar_007717 [Vaccinium darrowii]|uniref:Uncharacterized protein n=1 Tax=Vaccinium darrowii TaxID=229202 RepID=A0ACB7ZA00_9ERIC|nr:hypothetical protein Vadar_007717 [Vaccinium darrowii]